VSAPRLTLASHALCPYVQRAAIVLAEKGLAFERREVDLGNKPEWFRAASPLGKTPVLLVGEEPLFESAVICEYLEDTALPRLHPADALERARHRAYVEFASALLATIAGFYSASDEPALMVKRDELTTRFAQLERVLDASPGPYFAGPAFSIVDAAFAPVFRYFDAFEQFVDFGFFDATPRLRAWRAALAQRESVQQAAAPDYPERLMAFLRARRSALGARARRA
jgi:glutathione S-transferase